ncbi:hypothetical protein R0011_09713 [Lacticaseibacillus rhamnosus R0011]|nr:hypothetical protein LRH_01942 [Lacticaseibacillus rhamnosus HN001]EHJ22357.1 hypothetical protein R0011_09713 [Lacticaseibacillus rhamnosus R0011]
MVVNVFLIMYPDVNVANIKVGRGDQDRLAAPFCKQVHLEVA